MDEKAKAAVSTAATVTNAMAGNSPGNANDPAGKAEDWTSLLQLTPKGKVMATPENLTLIAENDPSLQTITYDLFH